MLNMKTTKTGTTIVGLTYKVHTLTICCKYNDKFINRMELFWVLILVPLRDPL